MLKVFADNTGVHAVGRCLNRRGRGIMDVAGLLQFATQIVFCDKILVGGQSFKFDPGVAEYTENVAQGLLRTGIDTRLLSKVEISQERWDLYCMGAALDFADDVTGLLSAGGVEVPSLNPEWTSKTISATRIHELFAEDRSTEELADIAGIARSNGAASVAEYCIAGSHELWESLHGEYVARGGWDIEITTRLEVLLRVYVNSLIGSSYGAIYSPAVPRAVLYEQASSIIEETLSRLVIEAAMKIAPRQLPVPALGGALVRESGGEVNKVLERALELRQRARPLRKLLAPLAEMLAAGDEEGAFQLQVSARELGTLLEEDLGLASRPQFRDALELKFIVGLPSPSLDLNALIAWVADRWNRRRVAILTDLAKTLAFRPTLGREYQRLARTCAPERPLPTRTARRRRRKSKL